MEKTVNLFNKASKVLKPPPKLTVSEWADSYRRLSSEASAEPGQWRTERAPYQKEIMDAVNDPEIEKVIIMSSAQIGKTELILNIIGYYVDYDPAPIMLVLPTLDLAEAFSKDRISPMFRDTPALRDKIKSNKSRDSNNTLLHKRFPGGHITLVGANSPASLASRPIRILLADEVDRYPHSAGDEGDPIDLASKRTTTFWNKKKVYVSTPTTKGLSKIEDEYENSTKEEWNLPCPSCKNYQPLKWKQIKFEDATMECDYCQGRFKELEWKSQKGIWIAREYNKKVRGFHLNELASPWKRWETIISEFKIAKRSKETLKVWINTSLGESWEEPSETNAEDLYKRRERYNAEVPGDVLVLTAGVDTQNDRLEVEVVGWGLEKESWGIEYKIFYGDPGQDQVWNQLDEYLKKEFKFADGLGIMISTTCIDTGGHFTSEVYKYCKPREHRRIYGIKGRGGPGVPLIGGVTRNNRERAALFTIGVDQGKQLLITRLKTEFEGPGYCHFPIEEDRGYNEKYFDGLTAERRVIKYSKGKPKVEWVVREGSRNEPFDIRNYATAALEILDPDLEMLSRENKTGNIYIQKSQMTSSKVTRKRRKKIISKGL